MGAKGGEMKKILFICGDNSNRSQIAEAFAIRFGKEVLEAASAGVNPSGEIDPMARAVLKERGFPTENLKTKGVDSLSAKSFDVCVHFGLPEETISGLSCGEIIDWGDIPDPKGKAYAEHRKTREKIGGRVLEMIRKIRDK